MNTQLQYPLTIGFKKIALTNKMTLRNNEGQILAFAHQKLLKLKEQVFLFTDESKTTSIGEVNADRVIDFSPVMTYNNAQGQVVVSVKRNGGKSIFKADYDIIGINGQVAYKVREANGWIKFLDTIVREVPIVGLFSGYFLNPSYNVMSPDETQIVFSINKQPALLESKYTIEQTGQNPPQLQGLDIACLIIIMRERLRG